MTQFRLALLAFPLALLACGPPSSTDRANQILESSPTTTTANGGRMALLSSAAQNVQAFARCNTPVTIVGPDSLVIETRCAVAIPRDTIVIAPPPDSVPPVGTVAVARITYACTQRPNLRYRCEFDGSTSTAPNGVASYVWSGGGEVAQTGVSAVFGFDAGQHDVGLAVTDSAGATVTTQRTVVVGTPLPPDSTPPPVDTITVPPDTTMPPTASVAALPRRFATYPATLGRATCTSTVKADLQAALDAAKGGDVICLIGTFRGSFTLGNRPDNGYVVIKSTSSYGLPGTRMTPSTARMLNLARIEATGNNAAFVTGANAHGWYLRELEITTDSSLSSLTYALIDLEAPATLAQMARDIVFDRVWAHGWAHRPLRRCFSLQSGATAIVDSWVDDCHEKGSDSQAIASWSGSGPYLIENNYLAGAGENILIGGSTPKFAGVHPSDITIRRNHFNTPLAWKTTWTKKNILELKNVQRILVERNVFEGSWGDGQNGVALIIKSANQSGEVGARDNGSRDVTIVHNLIMHASTPININGRGGDAGNIDSLSRRIDIVENYATDLGGAYGLDGRGVMILTGAQHVRMVRNTWLAPPGQVNTYTGGSAGTASTAYDLTIDHDLLTRGKYGRMGCWTVACAPGLVFDAAIVGAGAASAPFTVFPDLASAHAAGYGVSRAVIDALVRGVVVVP